MLANFCITLSDQHVVKLVLDTLSRGLQVWQFAPLGAYDTDLFTADEQSEELHYCTHTHTFNTPPQADKLTIMPKKPGEWGEYVSNQFPGDLQPGLPGRFRYKHEILK